MIAFCRADGCLLLLILVRSRSTGGFESLDIFWAMPVVTATSLCEDAWTLASLLGARTAFIKLKLQGAAWIVASVHASVSAEIRQSAAKPCNTAMPRRRYCRARSDLEALLPGY